MASISWKSGINGDWSTAADWAGGVIPGAGDDVTIAAAGSYTVTINGAEAAHSLTLNAASAKVVDNALFTLGAALSIQAGSFTLAGSGDIVGGTISTGGSGVFLCAGGTLTSTTYQGTLSLAGSGSSVTLQGADTFAGAGGSGAGAINLTGSSARLYAQDTTTLDNATLTAGNGDTVYLASSANPTATLTLGSHFDLLQSATSASSRIDLYSDTSTNGILVNQGTITASASKGSFDIYGGSSYGTFINAGTLAVSNGDSVTVDTGVAFINNGIVTIAAGSSLALAGSVTTGSLATIANSGTLALNGAVNNAGSTLTIGSTGVTSLGGTITGGTVAVGGGTFTANAGTLSGVTYDGTLSLTAVGNSVYLAGANTFAGAGGTGAGAIILTGSNARLYAQDTTTLDHATLTAGNGDTVYLASSANPTATLTLGSHFDLLQSATSASSRIDLYSDTSTNGILINQGTITTSASKGSFDIYGGSSYGTFINAGTLAVSNGDSVTVDTGVAFINNGAVTIGAASSLALDGSVTTGSLATIANSGTLALNGAINNAGSTLTIGSTGVTTLGGTITGGTIVDNAGKLAFRSGTLSGVTYQGTLTLATNTTINIVGGLNVAHGAAAGVISDTGSGSALNFYDTQTLDNAIVNIGSSSGASNLSLYEDTGTFATLTLGSHLLLTQAGQLASIDIDPQGGGGNALVSQGTITAGVMGGTFDIIGYAGDSFTNQGSLIASNGCSIVLATNVTTGGLGAFSTKSGGTILLAGGETLSNAGATLALGTGSQLTLAGTIQGGTVADSGGGLVAQGGTLAGVTYLGTLTLAPNTQLAVTGGLDVSSGGAAGVINNSNSGAQLIFYDTQTLDHATLNLGAASGDASLYVENASDPTATLTLGSHLSLNAGKFAQIVEQNSGGALVNQGTITAGVAGGSLDIESYYNNDTFTNQGSLVATNGDTILFDTNITTAGLGAFSTSGGGAVELDSFYTLSNTGATLALGTASQLTLAGTIQGGTVADSGGGLAQLGGTLSGVTYQGSLTITNLTVTNGLSVQTGGGAGLITDTGVGAQLTLLDTQTLDNATLTIGNSSGSSSIIFDEDTGGPATLTLGRHLALAETGQAAQITIDQQNVGNALVNQGTITAATSSGTLVIYGQYARDTLANTGSLIATSGGTLDFSNVATFSNVAAGTLTGGYYEADAHATLQVTNNLSIATDAATIVLSGTGSVFESTKTSNSTQVTLDKSLTAIASTGTLELLAGRSLAASGALTDAGLLQLGGGTLSIAGGTSGLTIAAGGRLAGFGTVAPALADNGTVEATGALVLARAVTGTGGLQIDAGATLELKASTTSSETVTFAGAGGTLLLDQPASAASPIAGFAAGDTIGIGALTATSATITGQALSITLSGGSVITETLVGSTSGERAGLGAGGHSVIDYRFAQATLTPTTLAFGNHHVGDTVSSTLTLTNTAPADGYSEKLDGMAAGTTGAATVSGSFAGLAAGQSDGTDIHVGLNTGSAGAVSGTGTVALSTDGAGVDGGAPVAIASQGFAVSGAVYAYAAPTLSTTTLNFGAARLGGTVSGMTLTLGDGSAANAYQESLDYALSAPAGFTGAASGTLASGGSTTVSLALATGMSGDFTGTQLALSLASDGTAIGDGLGVTALPGQTVTLNGKVYGAAVAQLGTTALNFGVVHVGDTGADTMLSLLLTNGATGALTDVLTGGVGSVSGSFGGSGSLGAGLAAGQSGSLGFQISTSSSGSLSGTALLALLSHDPDLADLMLSTGAITLVGAVDNYAVAALAETSGGGTFMQTGDAYTLDLGQIAQGASPVAVGLEALNAATGLADLLDGTLTASGSGAFTVSGLGSFSGLGAGQSDTMPQVTLSTSQTGTFTETIVLTSEGTNASGYAGALAGETLTITGTIVAAQSGQTYVLTKSAKTINAGSGNDTFVAASNTLVAGDHLDGGGGSNTLSLVGGGTFNLATPASLADIAVIAAQEGQAAGGGQASTLQTVTLRAGLDAAVNVAAASLNGSDPNPAAITINGAANADVITLASGTDTVLNLGASETVDAGTGTDLVRAAIGSAGAAVVGQSTGTATLELTAGGTATLNAADTHLTVQLDAATTLHLGGMGFITAVGGKANDSLYAGGASQVLEGGGGKNSLSGAVGGDDIFLDTTKNIGGDTIMGWTTGDMLDITDMSPSTARITGFTGGKLSVTDGTLQASIAFTGSLSAGNFVVLGTDGHGGTLIGYHG